jgi:hypothetical protein
MGLVTVFMSAGQVLGYKFSCEGRLMPSIWWFWFTFNVRILAKQQIAGQSDKVRIYFSMSPIGETACLKQR